MKLRVKAVAERAIPLLAADGKPVPGAYAGMTRDRKIKPEGEVVEDVGGYYIRAVADGDLEQLQLDAEVAS